MGEGERRILFSFIAREVEDRIEEVNAMKGG